MSAELMEIREALTAVLAGIPDLNTSGVELGAISTPSATVLTPDIDYYKSFGSTAQLDLDFTVWVSVGAQLTDEGARNLTEFAAWAGTKSVLLAFEADATLGGLVEDVTVKSFRSMGIEDVGGIGSWGGMFTINVLGRRPA